MGRSDVQGAPDLARTTRHTWLREAMHRAAQPDVNSVGVEEVLRPFDPC